MSVAIVIPAFNSASFLPAVIASATGQIESASEIVVVDDGSTDDTREVCAKLGDGFEYVRQENAGVASARNHGASRTRAEWLLFLDSDDTLLPHATRALLASAGSGNCGVAYGRVLFRGPTPAEARLHGLPSAAGKPPHPARKNFKRAILSTPGAAIVRRDIFEQTGGFVPGYEPMEDRDLWMKAGMLTAFAFADTVVLDKTFREGSAGTQVGRRIANGLRAQVAFFDWCRTRGLDTGFLGTTVAGVVDQAFRDAIWHRRWEVVESLRRQADELGVRSIWYHRAGLQLRLLRLFGIAK